MASPAALALMNRLAVPAGLRRALASGAGSRTELLASAWWSFASAVVARGANVLVLMICARALVQARFGELAIIQSTVGMFGPLAGLGLGVTTTKYLAEYRQKDPARAGSILGLSLVAAILSGLLMSGLLIALAPVLAAKTLGSPRLAHNLVVGSGLLFFGVVEAVQTGALTGLEAFYRIARLSAWNGLLSLPLTAFLVYRFGVDGALVGMTASLALACLMNGIVLRRESRRYGLKASLRGCWSEWPILLSFSLPSYLGGIIVAPASWAASALLVNRPGGYPEMALFSAADRWRYFLIFVPLSVSRIAVPVFSRFRSAGDQAGYRGAYRANLLLGAVLTVVPAILCGLFFGPFDGHLWNLLPARLAGDGDSCAVRHTDGAQHPVGRGPPQPQPRMDPHGPRRGPCRPVSRHRLVDGSTVGGRRPGRCVCGLLHGRHLDPDGLCSQDPCRCVTYLSGWFSRPFSASPPWCVHPRHRGSTLFCFPPEPIHSSRFCCPNVDSPGTGTCAP